MRNTQYTLHSIQYTTTYNNTYYIHTYNIQHTQCALGTTQSTQDTLRTLHYTIHNTHYTTHQHTLYTTHNTLLSEDKSVHEAFHKDVAEEVTKGRKRHDKGSQQGRRGRPPRQDEDPGTQDGGGRGRKRSGAD